MKTFLKTATVVFACLTVLTSCTKKNGDGSLKPDDSVPDVPSVIEPTQPQNQETHFGLVKQIINVSFVNDAKSPTDIKLVEDANMVVADSDYAYDATLYSVNERDTFLDKWNEGVVDIGVIPVDMALDLYKQQTDVTVFGVNAYAPLYIAEIGNEVKSFENLQGRTLYLTKTNAVHEKILKEILSAKNLVNGVNIVLAYKQTEQECLQAMQDTPQSVCFVQASEIVKAQQKIPELRAALDVNEQWSLFSGKQVPATVSVTTKGFADRHPDAIKDFLTHLEKADAYAREHHREMTELLHTYQFNQDAPVVGLLPLLKPVVLYAENMKDVLKEYYNELLPRNVNVYGSIVMRDDFYYVPETSAADIQ